MYKELTAVISDVQQQTSRHSLISGHENYAPWHWVQPKNQAYVQQEGLDKTLKFGRTLYIPYSKVLVISGEDTEINKTVSDTFIFHLTTQTIERMPNILHPRTSFAAHYDFSDQFVYVIGGNNHKGEIMKECEKFDVFNQKWLPMPRLNMERANPGTFITEDRRYLYVFQGFRDAKMTADQNFFRQNEALDTIERLDLWDPHAQWEMHSLSPNTENILAK